MVPQVAAPVQPAQPLPPSVAEAPQAPATPVPAAAPLVAAPAKPDEALWTSTPFKGTVSALATGNVDGSGSPEIVFAHENQSSSSTGMAIA
jgi:hypothetical protein